MDNKTAKLRTEQLINHELAHADGEAAHRGEYIESSERTWRALRNTCRALVFRDYEMGMLRGNLTLAEAKLNLVRAERDMLAAELRLVKLQLKELLTVRS